MVGLVQLQRQRVKLETRVRILVQARIFSNKLLKLRSQLESCIACSISFFWSLKFSSGSLVSGFVNGSFLRVEFSAPRSSPNLEGQGGQIIPPGTGQPIMTFMSYTGTILLLVHHTRINKSQPTSQQRDFLSYHL